ncbi:hypothetical protein [Bradyrhizobium brasilense]|uniref:Uncharacterized protein n=1 Tax=Bradyrhizobium brasilense TaxID=1419277 RepID=A0A1G7MWH7_9BRAD|nr:hypothetical protein [Bradyrhizobium brasilense]MCC8974632.1 hypothetical protein [Bradyrhizobium brasilense]SDF66021.1 hypothetical protein SAMN05216337_106627 [Bradyrhizobium brasilense]
MKDVLSLAVFAGKVLCFLVFIIGLNPNCIGAVQSSTKPAYCKIARTGLPGFGLNLLAMGFRRRRSAEQGTRVAHCGNNASLSTILSEKISLQGVLRQSNCARVAA